MIKRVLISAVLVLLSVSAVFPQPDTLYALSWNVENFFDTMDDPYTEDDEYTAEGSRNWTEERLTTKIRNLASVLNGAFDGAGPDIIALQEIENEYLLIRFNIEGLNGRYGIAHAESQDGRGIDNALLYDKEEFRALTVQAHRVYYSDDYVTRDIIEAELLHKSGEKLYCFVNHWPSRRGGREESEPRRIAAAQTLRREVDRILSYDPGANIMILGDFNDEPENISVTRYLTAVDFDCGEYGASGELYNLSYESFAGGIGTYMYQQNWNMLDQIIVSLGMMEKGGFEYVCGTFEVIKPEEIVTREGRFQGASIPTYGGRNYLGGYSDHFPVGAKFIYGEAKR